MFFENKCPQYIGAFYLGDSTPLLLGVLEQSIGKRKSVIHFYEHGKNGIMAKVIGGYPPVNLGNDFISPYWGRETFANVFVTIEGENIEKVKEINRLKNICGNGFVRSSISFKKLNLWCGEVQISVWRVKDGKYSFQVDMELPILQGTPFWIGEEIPKLGSKEPQFVSVFDLDNIIHRSAPTRLRGLWYTVFVDMNDFVVVDTTGDDTIWKGPGSAEDLDRWRKEMEDSKDEGGIENGAK